MSSRKAMAMYVAACLVVGRSMRISPPLWSSTNRNHASRLSPLFALGRRQSRQDERSKTFTSGRGAPSDGRRRTRSNVNNNFREEVPSRRQKDGGRVGNRKRHVQHKRGEHSGQVDGEKSASTVHMELPQITNLPEGPFPSFFSCRHGYEQELIEEIEQLMEEHEGSAEVRAVASGLVEVVPVMGSSIQEFLGNFNPTYALQSIPNCIVQTAPSIKKLASEVLKVVDLDDARRLDLQKAPRGSLAVHAVVPGMFKGQKNPMLQRRALTIADEVVGVLKKAYPCARPAKVVADEDIENEAQGEKWILQILLCSPEVVASSLVKCWAPFASGEDLSNTMPASCSWPNWKLPAGMAMVDIEESMPSSAYRKLLEAFSFMGHSPGANRDAVVVVDLGASPGGWTAALRKMEAKVIAVDRSPLRRDLMDDDMVAFVSGDAFAYRPPWAVEERAVAGTWMVSDIIAYPDRILELISEWTKNNWAQYMVVTIKFQGSDVPWNAIAEAKRIADENGYDSCVKHFFNNKNEVTFMAIGRNWNDGSSIATRIGLPMFMPILPKQ